MRGDKRGECEELAKAIFTEVAKQAPCRAAMSGPDLHHVLLEGQIDLIKVASSLAARFCIMPREIETVPDKQMHGLRSRERKSASLANT